MIKNDERHIFVSPHFDDAIGSCGGTISKLVKDEKCVFVLTPFAGENIGELSNFAIELNEVWRLNHPVRERKFENKKACSVLGCNHHNYDFVEAIYRKSEQGLFLYPNGNDIFKQISPHDCRIIPNLVSNFINDHGDGDIYYFPFGIGRHVDHLILKYVGDLLSELSFKVLYYRDFYYDIEQIENNIFQDYETVKFEIEEEDFNNKIESFTQYVSQIPMLFENKEKMVSYFLERDKCNNVFYEILYKYNSKLFSESIIFCTSKEEMT
ncbi:MAG: PIG-L family deacetylase [Fusobacteriaceae bacterium]|nr:PIG-L family deacetylase [Fusobacteriaceae bacterium]